MLQGERLSDHASKGKAHNIRAGNVAGIQHVDHVAHEIIQRAVPFDVARSTVAAQVEADDTERARQRRGYRIPARPIGADTVDQHDRLASSFILIEQCRRTGARDPIFRHLAAPSKRMNAATGFGGAYCAACNRTRLPAVA
jgi:hypothetical protein